MTVARAAKDKGAQTVSVPILCNFWQEDEVWNGAAADLPVAVFGDSFDEAMAHMRDALVSHFTALARHGELDAVISKLQAANERSLRVRELPERNPLVKLVAAVRDHKVLSVA